MQTEYFQEKRRPTQGKAFLLDQTVQVHMHTSLCVMSQLSFTCKQQLDNNNTTKNKTKQTKKACTAHEKHFEQPPEPVHLAPTTIPEDWVVHRLKPCHATPAKGPFASAECFAELQPGGSLEHIWQVHPWRSVPHEACLAERCRLAHPCFNAALCNLLLSLRHLNW